jgi:hypothetical protein
VLAQDPPARAQGIAQPSINLLVAAAGDDAPDGFVMPDLTGLPVVSAQAELARVGIQSTAKFVDVPMAPMGSGDCAAKAAGEAGRGHGATTAGRRARGAEFAGEADGGEVSKNRETGNRDQGRPSRHSRLPQPQNRAFPRQIQQAVGKPGEGFQSIFSFL